MQIAPRPIQAISHDRHRATWRMRRSTGKVRPHASNPCGKLKLLAVANSPLKTNFQAVEIFAPITTSPATRKSAGKKEGNPEAKIQISYFAGVKIVSAASQKQMATAPGPRPARRNKTQMPATVSQQQTTESIIRLRT